MKLMLVNMMPAAAAAAAHDSVIDVDDVDVQLP